MIPFGTFFRKMTEPDFGGGGGMAEWRKKLVKAPYRIFQKRICEKNANSKENQGFL